MTKSEVCEQSKESMHSVFWINACLGLLTIVVCSRYGDVGTEDLRGTGFEAAARGVDAYDHAYHQDIAASMRQYTLAIRACPANQSYYVERAAVNHRLGDLEGALHDYNSALSLKKDNVGALRGRISVLVDLKEYHVAMRDLSRVKSLGVHAAALCYQEGYILWCLGMEEKALRMFEEAESMDAAYHICAQQFRRLRGLRSNSKGTAPE